MISCNICLVSGLVHLAHFANFDSDLQNLSSLQICQILWPPLLLVTSLRQACLEIILYFVLECFSLFTISYISSFGTLPNHITGFPGSGSVKESTCNAGYTKYMGLIPGSERSCGGEHGNSLQHSCLKNSMLKRSLFGNSPMGHKESDMTEGLMTERT